MSVAPPPNKKNRSGNGFGAGSVGPGDPWSLRLLSVAGIPIRLHFTFLLFLLWIALLGKHGLNGLSVIFVIAIFACVVLHELGHSFVAMREGIPVLSITLYPIGGVASIDKRPKPGPELRIAVAGPLVNVAVALLLWLIAGAPQAEALLTTLSGTSDDWRAFTERLLLFNLWMATFNLIPAFPMDGGRILRALLALVTSEQRATAFAAQVGQTIAIVAGVAALWSHPINWFLAFVAFFIYIGAGQEAGAFRREALLEGMHVRDAMMTDVRTLSVGATLKEAADILLDTSQHDFPVVHGGVVQGLLTRNGLLRGLAEQGPHVYVAGVMERGFAAAGPDDDLGVSLPRLQSAPGPLLVLEGDRLLGIVTADNIQELLAIRQIAAKRDPGPSREQF